MIFKTSTRPIGCAESKRTIVKISCGLTALDTPPVLGPLSTTPARLTPPILRLALHCGLTRIRLARCYTTGRSGGSPDGYRRID